MLHLLLSRERRRYERHSHPRTPGHAHHPASYEVECLWCTVPTTMEIRDIGGGYCVRNGKRKDHSAQELLDVVWWVCNAKCI